MNQVELYSTSNSQLISNRVEAIAIYDGQEVWFGTDKGISVLSPSGSWRSYNKTNTDLPTNWILDIAFDREGNGWFGVNNNGVSMRSPDGTWQNFNWDNSGLNCQQASEIAIDKNGNRWFGCEGKVSVFDTSNNWTQYDTTNSGLKGVQGTEIFVDSENNKWFGEFGSGQGVGVSKLSSEGIWTNYNTQNSGIVENSIMSISEDSEGNMWFGSWNDGISILNPAGRWETFNSSNSHLKSDSINDIKRDYQGNMWVVLYGAVQKISPDGIWKTFSIEGGDLPERPRFISFSDAASPWLSFWVSGAGLLHQNGNYRVDLDPKWLNDTSYRAQVEINTTIPRDNYSIIVENAFGTDGVEGIKELSNILIVDYAGAISDNTPPLQPIATLCADTTLNSLTAYWYTKDLESKINMYRYAVGTSIGSTDIINWTNSTKTSISLSGLILNNNQEYYLAVQARNEGGIWSLPGLTEGVKAGTGTCSSNFISLPLVRK